jgi:sugar lactone lactonase YvrE
LNSPTGLALDSSGNVYVVNSQTNTIEKFTASGAPSRFASTGVNNPSFGPGLAIDKAGYVYAEAPTNYPAEYFIEKFAPNGTSTLFAADPGNGSVLNEPQGMAFDGSGNLYVVNIDTGTIEKFTTNGAPSLFATSAFGGLTCIVIQPSESAAPPTLFITRNGTNAIISWPVAAGSFALQSTPSLGNPSWATLTNTPATVNANFVETIGITGSAQFFRLKSN